MIDASGAPTVPPRSAEGPLQTAGSDARTAREPRHYDYLDSLRGIAALAVVAVHTVQNFHARAIEPIIGLGQYGVQLFYIVSAFSLCLSLSQRGKNEHNPLLNYALRRFFRIAPLFYLAVVVYLVKRFWVPPESAPVILDPITWSLRWWHVVATVLFVNGWHPHTINLVVPGGWSVAVETGFYLVLPLIFRRTTSLRLAVRWFVYALAIEVICRKSLYLLFAARVPAAELDAFGVFSGMWLPSQLPVFMLGIVMFQLRALRPVETAGAPVGMGLATGGRWRRWFVAMALSSWGAGVGLLLAAAFAATSPRIVTKVFSKNAQISLVCFCACLVLAARPFRAVVNAATIRLGKISYSLYLFHFVSLQIVIWARRSWHPGTFGAVPDFFVAFPFVLLIACGIAATTFRLVEQPGQALGRRVVRALEQRWAAVDGAPPKMRAAAAGVGDSASGTSRHRP